MEADIMADLNKIKLPVSIAGSNVFGRYPKIDPQQTYNMFISDGWAVDFAGHKRQVDIEQEGEGRGIFYSPRYNHMLAVITNGVYIIDESIDAAKIAEIDTFAGDVFFAENNANQIAICDKQDIYIFDYTAASPAFQKVIIIDFIPIHIAFQDGYFIAAAADKAEWRLSALNDGFTWGDAAENVGEFQTKADSVVACIPVPGKENQLMVMGSIVTQFWTDRGLALFPYQRNTGFNIDYGCLNAATIASGDNFVIWLGANEKSGPVIMYTSGGTVNQVSTDGINFKLSQLANPENAYGFLFKQDGHLFYQLTFPGDKDNLTLLYDFTTDKFFSLTDEFMNFHIAKRLAYFKNSYYFVSFRDGDIYELNNKFTEYDGEIIPRVRVTDTLRAPDTAPFIGHHLSFPIEQGYADEESRLDFAISKDGGASFGNYVPFPLNTLGTRKNHLDMWDFGYCNELTFQMRVHTHGRIAMTDGIAEIYK